MRARKWVMAYSLVMAAASKMALFCAFWPILTRGLLHVA
jgi:hypothetical protein